MLIFFLVLGILSVDALNFPGFKRAELACTEGRVRSFIASVSKKATQGPESFCSSYLGYSQVSTTETTIASVTDYRYTTIKEGTVTVTATITKTKKGKGQLEEKRAVSSGIVEVENVADSSGRVYGFVPSVASAGCSCLVTKSTGVKTITVTSTETTTEFKPVILKQKTITEKVTTTVTSTPVVTPRSICGSASNPIFHIQLRDADPKHKDKYDGDYLALAPDTYRGSGIGRVVISTTSKSKAALLILDLQTGHLSTADGTLFAAAEYFVALSPVYFDPSYYIDQQGSQYLQSSISNGLLNVYVQYPQDRRVTETCPEYARQYDTPFALGASVYTDGPVCYGKQMVVVPVCTPE